MPKPIKSEINTNFSNELQVLLEKNVLLFNLFKMIVMLNIVPKGAYL